MTRYVFDTNVYIRAWRNPDEHQLQLEAFHQGRMPVTYLSSVVYHELLVGATGPAMARDISKQFAEPFIKTGRVIAPSHSAWAAAARAISDLVRTDGLNRRELPRGFVNDALIAASCRESGLTLVTANERDFGRLRKCVEFSFIAPWPA